MASPFRLIVSDFIVSFMWVWSGALIKMFVYGVLDLGHEVKGEIIKYALSVLNLYFFAYLGKVTHGGSYNPVTVLAPAISGDFSGFLFTVGTRIPVQVIGSICGVNLIVKTFPEIGRGPKLHVDIYRGALTEGLLTFTIVMVYLFVSEKLSGGFYTKTWIKSLSKLTLNTLGSDLTGGVMNPASVTGWLYARGDYASKENILVYWIAPIEATVLAAWTYRWLNRQPKDEKLKAKPKSE